MRNRTLAAAVLLMVASFGCSGGVPKDEVQQPDVSQAEIFKKLRDQDISVVLDDGGKIISVEFEKATQGDDSLALLKEVPTLKYVNLAGSGVTDKGLVHLEGIKTLESVGLEDTRITVRGARKLKQDLPNCRVAYGSDRDSE